MVMASELWEGMALQIDQQVWRHDLLRKIGYKR